MNKKTLFLFSLVALTLPFAASALTVVGMAQSIADNLLKVADAVVIIGWVITGILFLTAGGGSRVETAKKALFSVLAGTILVIILHLAGGALTFIQNSIS